MTKSPPRSLWAAMSLVFGANVSFANACQAWRSNQGRAAPRFFPPEVAVQVKAIACELPRTLGLPLSRLSTADIVREVQRCGIVATISDKTVWRWLNDDAIRPWQHRCWIFPRDPDFATKAGRILDLYSGQWQGHPLQPDEFVISADEKTSIQARVRKHPSLPARPGQPARIEHEYTRGGAWAYLAALDVHRAKVFGRCEQSTGIDPFDRLVAQVMNEPPLTAMPVVYFGLSTTALPIVVKPPSNVFRPPIPKSFPSTALFTPVGSIKLRSTSLLSNERSSRRTTSPLCMKSRIGYFVSRSITRQSLGRLNGNLLVQTSMR